MGRLWGLLISDCSRPIKTYMWPWFKSTKRFNFCSKTAVKLAPYCTEQFKIESISTRVAFDSNFLLTKPSIKSFANTNVAKSPKNHMIQKPRMGQSRNWFATASAWAWCPWWTNQMFIIKFLEILPNFTLLSSSTGEKRPKKRMSGLIRFRPGRINTLSMNSQSGFIL